MVAVHDTVRFDGDHLPVWDEATDTYVDPRTGEVLPTWDEALDAIGDHDEPRHVVRFGDRFDAQGVLAGSKDASRCIGYLTKYLTKHVGDCHRPAPKTRPRTPTGSPKRSDMSRARRPARTGCATGSSRRTPGRACGQAAARERPTAASISAMAGGRVLVSPKWSGKTLADHRGDRKAWLTGMLGLRATDPTRYTWEPVKPGDPDHMPNGQRLLHVVADRIQWQTALEQARRRAAMPTVPELSATGAAV